MDISNLWQEKVFFLGPRLHVTCTNRIHLSTRIQWYPDSLLRNWANTLCRHIGLLLGKRLDTILLRHRIHRPHVIGFIADLFIYFFSTLDSRFKNMRIRCRIRCMRVDESSIRKEKVVDSKISRYDRYVWTGP